MACIIHYPHYNNILKLVDLNEKTFQTLLENKKIRKILGSENAHDEKCLNIPNEYQNGLKYHRECYQKFTYAKTLFKRKIVDGGEPSSVSQSSGRSGKNIKLDKHLFPEYYYFCKKNRITVKKQDEYPTNIVTYEAQETLVNVAGAKVDFELLGAIKDVDLIAGEFKKHKSCYKSYTRTRPSKVQSNEPAYEKGNFEAVCSTINSEIIEQRKSISIDT